MLLRRMGTWWRQLLHRKRKSRFTRSTAYVQLRCEVLEIRDCPAELGSSFVSRQAITPSSLSRPIAITRPTTITQPGLYQLQNDVVVSSGVGITVAASDVVIDLNGHSLIGPGTASNTSIGIWASNRDRVTIRNGTIDNFFYGIYLSDSADYVISRGRYFDQGGHIIENVRFYGNTFRAIRVEGVANIIRNNIIYDTGGSHVYNPTYAAGIETYGPGTVIQDNIIYNIRGSGYGILVSNLGAGTTIQHNIVTATALAPVPNFSSTVEGLNSQAVTYAIAVKGPASNAIVSANSVANFNYGIAFLSAARGLISDNVVENTLIPYFAPSGAGPVILANDNAADRLNYIVSSASGLVTASGSAIVNPARQRSLPVPASTPGDTIRSITAPTVISQPGYYRLDADLRVNSGIAIQINADDVFLDLHGHALIGPGAARTTAIGIYAAGRNRIRISNGIISGFQYGIYLADNADAVLAGRAVFDTGGHIIENVRLYANTFRAIRIEGRGNVIRDNVIEDTGGCNLYSPPFAVAIEVFGPGNVIAHNHLYALRGQGSAIYVSALASGTVIQDNSITQADLYPSAAYRPLYEGLVNQALTWGIRIDSPGAPIIVHNNVVANFVYGVSFTHAGSGLISQNVVTGASAAYLATSSSVYFAASNVSDSSSQLVTQDANYASGTSASPPPGSNASVIGSNSPYFISGPTTITAPGTYILQRDIVYNSNGAAITIAASNVTLDFNGYQLIGPGSANNTAIGIAARNQDQITIRNGTIRGFMYGIYLSDDSDIALSGTGFNQGHHVIENMQLIGNTFRGLRVEGRGNVIRNNIVEDTGGTTVYGNPIVMGIESLGPGALIEDNYIYAVRGNGYGIAISGYGGGTIIRSNKLSNSSLWPRWSYRPGTDGVIYNGNTYGIWVSDKNGEVIARDNRIINFAVGIAWHPNSGGLISGNAVTQACVAYYIPGRPVPRVAYASDNSADPGSPIVTLEKDLLPINNSIPPPLYQGGATARQGVIPIYRPTVITRPGIYILQNNIAVSSGVAIEIRASDVVLDLNGFSINGPATASTRAIGIYAFNRDRIQIRNGTIRGFLYGIFLSSDQDSVIRYRTGFSHGGHVVENLRLVDNQSRAVRVEGRGNVVRNNLILNTGGTTIYPKSYGLAIDAIGPGALLEGNVVYNSFGMGDRGEGVGISVSTLGGGAVISKNIVANSGLAPDPSYAPWPGNSNSTWGIWAGDTTGGFLERNRTSALISDNLVSNTRYGVTIHSMSSGLISRNAAAGTVVPFYSPVRVTRWNSADNFNQADRSPSVYTVEANY